MNKNTFGFTLLELIVVLTVILLGVVIATPIFANFQIDAKTTGCRSNLRQISMIMFSYAHDRPDGEFPLWRDRNDPRYLNNQQPFHNTVRHLATNGYVNETRIWVCPADKWDGANNDIPVTPATNILNIVGRGNISYAFVAGHKLNGPENEAIVPLMADELNMSDNSVTSPWPMPLLSASDNHGADYRNVLYLDGHVAVVTGAAVNSIYYSFFDAATVQTID